MDIRFRPLQADEIDCFPRIITEKGVSLLLYKNARVDMQLLDEVVGPLNWQRHHNRDNANCIISIWDAEKGQWIDKEDTGTESNMEAQKGLASDSFKRAGFNWGIGRELYTAPFIWIDANQCEIAKNSKGKLVCNDKFKVKSITVEDGKIKQLEITTGYKTVYTYGKTTQQKGKPVDIPASPVITDTQIKFIDAEMKTLGLSERQILAQIKEGYNVQMASIAEITQEQYAYLKTQFDEFREKRRGHEQSNPNGQTN